MKAHKINGTKQNPLKSNIKTVRNTNVTSKNQVSAGKDVYPIRNFKIVNKQINTKLNLADIYLNSLASSGRKSVRSLLKTVGDIITVEQNGDKVNWEKLDYLQTQRVRCELLQRQYSTNTINLAMAVIKGIAKVAFNVGRIDSNQLTRICAVKGVTGSSLSKGRSLSQEEIAKMASVCDRSKVGYRNKAILLVGCYTGVRCSELTALKINDFDSQVGALKVICGKGRKDRLLYVSTDVVDALNKWIKCIPENEGGALFRKISKGGKVGKEPLSNWGVAVILRSLQEMSGVPAFSPHDLRRSFITKLLEKNVDLNTVRQLSGHSDLLCLLRYDKRNEKTQIEAGRNMKL